MHVPRERGLHLLFVTSDVVLNEAGRGDAAAANLRLAALAGLTVLEALPEASELCDNLLDAGAVPQNSRSDAEHIAIAAVHGVAYLVRHAPRDGVSNCGGTISIFST